jgi:hypothetical protein
MAPVRFVQGRLAARYLKQSVVWSFTRPHPCMNA